MGLVDKPPDLHHDTVPARHRVEIALPETSTVSPSDLEQLLRGWAMGEREGSGPLVLPVGLRWSGPRAGTAADEAPGRWIYALSWDVRDDEPARHHAATLTGDWDAALSVLAWFYDATRRDDDPVEGGPRAYAVAAANGLARRTGASVRVCGSAWTAPSDPEATWSVYVVERPAPDAVAAALHDVLPGAREEQKGLPTWVLEAPDGRGLWLEEVDLAGAETWDDVGDPGWAAVGALLALRTPTVWAVRIEGVEETADAETREELDAVARACAIALGGVAADSEGFLV